MDSQIAKTTQSLTKAEEMRNQTKLIMQPYANWEQYLTPAPLSIAILGELVFISSKTDFSINKNPPKDGYKHIRYPDSFRACLMQVCTRNRDQFRLHTMTVPDYMKTAVKILFQGNEEVVQAHLPDQLENIRVVADECLDLAGSTEKRFTDVINIIQELLEACVNAEHFYGEELEEIKKKLEENKIRKQSSEEAVKRSEKAAKAMEEEMKEAQESYKAAMDSLPSGWNMVAMELVAAVTESMSAVVTGLTSVVTQPVVKMCNATKTISETYKDIKGNIASADEVDKINIYSKSAAILACAEIFQQFVHDTTIDWKSLYDQKKKTPNTDFVKGQFIRINSSLEGIPECNPKKRAQEICEDAIDIWMELAIILKLTDSARAFDSKSKDVTKSPSLTPKPPMMFKEESKSEKKSASERASENARFRIEQSRAQLKETRGSYEKTVENMEKNQKELTEILITMRNCEVKEIDFNTTIKMLVKGMDAMGEGERKQWEKMVRFFSMVSNIVEENHSSPKDLLYNQAFQQPYTEVSEKYLMDRESQEFEQERCSCRTLLMKLMKAILRLKANARLERSIMQLLGYSSPKCSKKRMKSIQAAVESGFTEEEEDDYA
uniref:Uncharacterized protein n=1 Tax=Astyanax mexicanus TaxID=7994 RepID=A0A3B1INM9_ASTMX